jgi:hypothetical protein
MRKYLLVLVSTGLIGCATTYTTWEKSGSTLEERNTVLYECEKDARQSGYFGTGLIAQINMQSFFEKCMNVHGWNQVVNTGTSHSTITASPSDIKLHNEYQEHLKAGEAYCKRAFPKAAMGNPNYNKCVSDYIDKNS